MKLAIILPEVHQGWIGDGLPSITITDALVWAGEVFDELWTQDTVMEEAGNFMEEVDNVVKSQEELTEPMSAPKNRYGSLEKVES